MKKINLDELKLNNAKMSDDMLKEINGGCTGILLRSEGCNGCRASYWIIEVKRCSRCSSLAQTLVIDAAERDQLSSQLTYFSCKETNNYLYVKFRN